MNTFGVLNILYIYDKKSRDSLKKNLASLGYKYKESQMGGSGGAVVKTITIAWIHIEPLFGSLLINLLAASIYDLMKKLWSWHRKQRIVNSKYKPDVGFTINSKLFKSRKIYINFRLDQEISKEEIKKQIKKAKTK